MENMNDNDDHELGQAMNRLLNKEYYLEKQIKKTLQGLFEKFSDEFGIRIEFLDIALLIIFAHIDLLGRLYAGETSPKNTTKNAVLFMRKYLGEVDARYKEVSGLLYHMLRHGYVHVFTSKRIILENGEELDFTFSTSHKRLTHLSLKKSKENERSRNIVIYRMSLQVSQLYEDFLQAIDKYAYDIVHNQDISDRFEQSFMSRRIEDTEENLRKKKYNLESDFDYIYGQMPDSQYIALV
jgi:hypothetical protein